MTRILCCWLIDIYWKIGITYCVFVFDLRQMPTNDFLSDLNWNAAWITAKLCYLKLSRTERATPFKFFAPPVEQKQKNQFQILCRNSNAFQTKFLICYKKTSTKLKLNRTVMGICCIIQWGASLHKLTLWGTWLAMHSVNYGDCCMLILQFLHDKNINLFCCHNKISNESLLKEDEMVKIYCCTDLKLLITKI